MLHVTLIIFCLDSARLKQLVSGSTHCAGHTLDLLITRLTANFVSTVCTTQYLPSDNAAVTCQLNIGRPGTVKVNVQKRNFCDIDIKAFRNDMFAELFASPSSSLEGLVGQYEQTLKDILDRHAPLLQCTVTARPHAPWFNDDVRSFKRELGRHERRWKSSKLEIHNSCFKW